VPPTQLNLAGGHNRQRRDDRRLAIRDACAREPRTAQPIYKKSEIIDSHNLIVEPKQVLTSQTTKIAIRRMQADSKVAVANH
jgi:hypothetical protein